MSSGKRQAARKKSSRITKFEKKLAAAFQESALPGENIGFDDEACLAAARFALQCGSERGFKEPKVVLESVIGSEGHRHLRLAAVNDDMPFLVDSICATIAGFGLNIKRLIHPVIGVSRDKNGKLTKIVSGSNRGDRRESIIYVELERIDARFRRELERAIISVFRDVDAAVSDWEPLQAALEQDAAQLDEGEGAALLRWFLDRNFTLLSHEKIDKKGGRSGKLGLSRLRSYSRILKTQSETGIPVV